jgi:hypothetical protein
LLTSQAREKEQMLHIQLNLGLFRTRQIDQERQGINVDSSGNKNGAEASQNEKHLPLLVPHRQK